ncbi:Hypothetical predicted protein [Olea europaea subsp. europaea]|uniref:Uncharacterized protein n=1 Tax=Olea europaea subsp. europaea TaxID=158383 RepID=A0A8S0V2J4_OLEEU|nr:Hypothetical predicted protein [Olea europaea subsp. europaea]
MIVKIVVPSKYSRANVPRRLASVFDRLDPTRNRQNRPRISPAQARLPPISLSRSHPFNLSSMGNRHGQLQPGATAKFAHRYMYPPGRNRREKRAALARIRAHQD